MASCVGQLLGSTRGGSPTGNRHTHRFHPFYTLKAGLWKRRTRGGIGGGGVLLHDAVALLVLNDCHAAASVAAPGQAACPLCFLSIPPPPPLDARLFTPECTLFSFTLLYFIYLFFDTNEIRFHYKKKSYNHSAVCSLRESDGLGLEMYDGLPSP